MTEPEKVSAVVALPEVTKDTIEEFKRLLLDENFLPAIGRDLKLKQPVMDEFIEGFITAQHPTAIQAQLMREAYCATYGLLERQFKGDVPRVESSTVRDVWRGLNSRGDGRVDEGFIEETCDIIVLAQPGVDDFIPDYVLERAAMKDGGNMSVTPFLVLNTYLITYRLLEIQAVQEAAPPISLN